MDRTSKLGNNVDNMENFSRLTAVLTGHWTLRTQPARLGLEHSTSGRSCHLSVTKRTIEYFLHICLALGRTRMGFLGQPFFLWWFEGNKWYKPTRQRVFSVLSRNLISFNTNVAGTQRTQTSLVITIKITLLRYFIAIFDIKWWQLMVVISA